MKKKLRFNVHPFFLVSLIQMCRHGEREKAAEIVATELMIAASDLKKHRSSKSGSSDSDGGLVLLPTLKRQKALGYHQASPATKHEVTHDDYPRPTF